ncbi:biotinidase isoform X2 [Oncorhynchus mykiss]|uniref:Biotinidase n=1 Tax=Oncorhynchus mykiss TaxID=8022 RepID=A0A8C7ULC0_ONCMY|nr:biotinidase isoform X1 [Oncorhynchus mykiss]XP_036809137.1 biotinidase isoform X2 [Oncorhynchus mykiss]
MSLRVLLAVVVAVLYLSPVTLTWAGDRTEGTPGPSYVAAVYEHKVILNPEPHVPLSRTAALEHMMRNLKVYEEQAERAAEQGAQIIVFPEDGIHGFNFSRLSISGYLETIPDPLTEDWNPCTQPDRHNHTEVLQSLSCMARRHQLYLVANMPDLQPCPLTSHPHLDPSQTPCPPDGRWQFNTDVVFRSDGSLAARYHKQNLFFEKEFDTPPRLEVVTFDTPFAGRFGVFTCFDILFHDPTVRLLEKGIRQMIFPTAWMNLLPLLTAVQIQRAVSLGANVTLLAANLRHDSKAMTGSGIYTPSTSIYHHAFHHPGEPEEGKLLVLRIPVLDSDWLATQKQAKGQGETGGQGEAKGQGETGGQGEGEPLSASLPTFSPNPSPSPSHFISSMMCDPFSFVLLHGSEGQLTVCDGPLCCHLQYRRSPQGGNTELYALGAFAGNHTADGHFALQVCALVRCSGSEVSSCGKGVEEAESRVDFRLEGKFGTRYVYPSLLGSGMVVDGPDRIEKTTDGRVTMEHSGMSVGLVTACLYGRVYDQD